MAAVLERGFRVGTRGDALGNALGTRPSKALATTAGLLHVTYRLGPEACRVAGVL